MDRPIGRWILGVTLAGVACVAWAQAPTSASGAAEPPAPGPQHGHAHWGHAGWGQGGLGLLRNLRELGLTQAQHEQIHTIMAAAREQWQKTEGAAPGNGSFATLANPGDPGYSAAVQAAKQRAADRIQAMSDVQLEVYNVLTPQQKGDLVKVLAQKSARREQWRASHADQGLGGN